MQSLHNKYIQKYKNSALQKKNGDSIFTRKKKKRLEKQAVH